jgi:hypothetical protein
MLDNPQIHRVRDLASEITEQNAVMREMAEKSLETLSMSPPNTFLGHKTCHFPKRTSRKKHCQLPT